MRVYFGVRFFVVLLIWGWASGELGSKALVVFVALAAVAWIGLPRIANGANFVTVVLALLDIALVLIVFKGDLRIG